MNLVKMYTKVYEKPIMVRILKLFSHFCEALFAVVFVSFLYKAYVISINLALAFGTLSLISFIIVSLARLIINAPRPSDLFPELEFLREKKSSPSFPSRHRFCAALIATLTLCFSVFCGCMLLLVSLLLGASRVLLGRHFARDVVCGFILGALSGALTLIFSYNIIVV